MKYIKCILLTILLIPAISHAIFRIYTGTIGQDNAEFYFDDDSAVYLDGKEHQVKRLSFIRERERNDKFNFKVYYANSFKKILDKIVIENFDLGIFYHDADAYQYLTGYSLNGDMISLHKTFEYKKYDERSLREAEFNNIDYLQQDNTKDFYFKVIVSKQKNEEAKIVGIKIYSRHDGRLIQTITGIKGCEFNSYASIMNHEKSDYNFDGDNNDFFLVKDRYHGPNSTAEYYVYDKTQQQFVKLNLEGHAFRFDYEEKSATSYKNCPGKKNNDYIDLRDIFQYTGNNHYKRVKTECLYREGGHVNKDNNRYEYRKQRACKPKEIVGCRNYIDTSDYDEY
ncbi:hypothetical protein [Gilliamella intestini]|uniref:Uncharacterized protein n=1 Tax=Gilliamella intestini TaxID=1798183 RepID=A0A1C4CZJ8_9GAMM|nr:hypothetical protein [Gilliamella intestini]SCC24674.1 hypothetical protein GA0061080_10556 [Gilliamella intestini]